MCSASLARLLLAVVACVAASTASAVGVASVALNPDTVIGGVTCTGTVTLDGPAPAGGASVQLSSDNPSAKPPALIPVASGQTAATFVVATTYTDAQVVAFISASLNGSTQRAPLTINAVSLTSVVIDPPSVVGGTPVKATITLSGPAPKGGMKVELECSDPAASIPKEVTVPEGQSTATFTINSKRLAAAVNVTVTATQGYVSTTAGVALNPMGPESVAMATPNVKSGTPGKGTVTLTGPAPKGGLEISLTSNTRAASLPSKLKVPEGATTADFAVKTVVLGNSEVATITAKFGSVVQTATLLIDGPAVSSVTLNPTTVNGAAIVKASVLLAEAAPPGGVEVKLSSDQPSATMPPSVRIPAGKTTAAFTVKTVAVATTATANIKATANGSTPSAPLVINAPTFTSFKLKAATIPAEQTATATITISTPAPTSGLEFTLASDQKAAVVPAKIKVGEGRTSVTFGIKATKVKAQTKAVITATVGSESKTVELAIKVPSATG